MFAGDAWNTRLPHTIEAFWVLKGSIDRSAAYHRGSFLREYRLRDEQVPLLEFDPSNWEAPFAMYSQ